MAGTDRVGYSVLGADAIIPIIIVVFISIALYNVIELIVLTLGTFRRYSGLYFWSVLVATLGISFNAIGYLLKHLQLTSVANLYATIILIGWCTMITGQSVVLYSRLHLVVQNQKQLRLVLMMIIINAIWLDIPIIILVYGSNSSNPGPFLGPYSIFEKVQLTVFFIQETIISAIYVWEASKLFKLEKSIGNGRTRRVMNHLIGVNIIIILLDITILILEYTNKYNIQTAWKPFVYSVKLKMEFSVLNRLVDLVKPRSNAGTHVHSGAGHNHTKSVALVTFDEEGSQQQTTKGQHFDATGYSAHIGIGKSHQGQRLHETSVLKTTEIEIHTQERRADFEDDTVSLDRKSGLTIESLPEGRPERDCTSSASSSEIQFARTRP